jgi:hypothetical protein
VLPQVSLGNTQATFGVETTGMTALPWLLEGASRAGLLA